MSGVRHPPPGSGVARVRIQARWIGPTVPLVLFVLLGCGGEHRIPGDGDSVWRWIETAPDEKFEPWKILGRETVASWAFDEPGELENWSLGPQTRPLNTTPAGAAAGQPRVALERRVDLDAAIVDELRVELSGLRHGRLELWWAGRGQPYSKKRHASIASGAVPRTPVRTFRFQLAEHRNWSGRIARLRIAAVMPADRETNLILREVRCVRWSRSREAMEHAFSRPWKVDLGGEVRDSLLARVGSPLEREVKVAPGSVLRLAFGQQGEAAIEARFRVSAVPRGGPALKLFEAIPASTGRWVVGRWNEVEIELSQMAGKKVRLALEVDADPSIQEETPLFWAHPEIFNGSRTGKRPNLVLIVIDTLRADHLSLYGYHRSTSPRLDSWARQRAVVFRNAVAPAPWTLPSHASLFTGLEAIRHGVNYPSRAPGSLTTMAEVFRGAGYFTRALTGGGFLDPAYGLAQGFDVYRYWPSRGHSDREFESTLETAVEWFQKDQARPFFLFFHTYEVHAPFRRREPYFSRFYPADTGERIRSHLLPRQPGEGFVRRGELQLQKGDRWEPLPAELEPLAIAQYDSAVAFVDAGLGRLFDFLDGLNLSRRTIVAITSDHGELLGEHGLANHMYLYEENLLVPLVVAAPNGIGAGREIANQVRLIDLLPTLAELAGIPLAHHLDGRSLLPLFEGSEEQLARPAWSFDPRQNWGVALRLDNRVKYIFNPGVWPPIRGRQGLYNVEDDPGEQFDLSREDPEAERLRSRVTAYLERHRRGLEVVFANRGTQEIQGRLAGDPITEDSIKSTDLPCDCLEWIAPAEVAFRIPPEERFTIWFELVPGPALSVQIAPPPDGLGPAPIRADLDLRHLESATWIHRVGGRWRQESGESGFSGVGLLVRWLGGHDLRPMLEPDEDLRRRLETLGYL